MTVLYDTGVGRRRWLAALVAEVSAVQVAVSISSEMWRTASRGPPTPLSDTLTLISHSTSHAVPYVLPLSYLFSLGMKAWGPKPSTYNHNDYGGHHSFSSLSPVSVSDVVGSWVQRFKSRRRAVKRRNHCWTIYSARETLGIPSPQTLHAKIDLKFILPPILFVLPIFSFFLFFVLFFISHHFFVLHNISFFKIFLHYFVHPTFLFFTFFCSFYLFVLSIFRLPYFLFLSSYILPLDLWIGSKQGSRVIPSAFHTNECRAYLHDADIVAQREGTSRVVDLSLKPTW